MEALHKLLERHTVSIPVAVGPPVDVLIESILIDVPATAMPWKWLSWIQVMRSSLCFKQLPTVMAARASGALNELRPVKASEING